MARGARAVFHAFRVRAAPLVPAASRRRAGGHNTGRIDLPLQLIRRGRPRDLE